MQLDVDQDSNLSGKIFNEFIFHKDLDVIKDTVEAIYNDVVKNQSSTKYKINIRNELNIDV